MVKVCTCPSLLSPHPCPCVPPLPAVNGDVFKFNCCEICKKWSKKAIDMKNNNNHNKWKHFQRFPLSTKQPARSFPKSGGIRSSSPSWAKRGRLAMTARGTAPKRMTNDSLQMTEESLQSREDRQTDGKREDTYICAISIAWSYTHLQHCRSQCRPYRWSLIEPTLN